MTSVKPIIRRMRCEQIGNIRWSEEWNLESLFECRAKLYWHKKYKGSLTVGETPENPNLICTFTFHHTKSCSKLNLRPYSSSYIYDPNEGLFMLNHNLFENISSLIRCEWPQWNIQTALLPVKILNLKKNSNNESFIMSSPMKNKCEIKKKRKITAWGPWSKCLDNSCDTDLAIKIRRYEYSK